MIGPRSALFTPFSNLGIIIIDEEHEESYKSETVPRYHARETAQRRAEMEGAKLILGSATPSVESYYRAEKGEYCLLEMKRRANRQKLPYVWIGDMRNEMREGNRSILSRYLQEQLGMCLERGDQAMLFLNRRGYAGFVACRSCGTVIGCPHCNVSLSLHKKVRQAKSWCVITAAIHSQSSPLSVLRFSFYRKFSGGDTAGSKPGAAYVSEGTYFAYGC